MSLAAIDPESQRDVVLLQDLLHKREYHLAELIDEVVFAEQERFKAVQEAHSVRELATHLEHAFDQLLQYHITMQKEVLLPTLVASVDVDGVNSRRASLARSRSGDEAGYDVNGGADQADFPTPSNDFLNDLLAEPQLSRETKQLLQAVMQQRRSRKSATSAAARPFPPSMSLATSPVEAADVVQHTTRRAIVLSDSLLRNQETLTRLLRSIQDQAETMLDRWSHGEANTHHKISELPSARPAATAPADPDVVQTPSQRGATTSKPSLPDASPVAPFRLENLHQHSERAREIEEALRRVEAERDALQWQLRERESAPPVESKKEVAEAAASARLAAETEAWGRERVHLKQELAYAQQRALEEQAKCRDLKKQVAQLEQIAATSPIAAPPPPAQSTPCRHCEKARAELKRKAADYHAAKAAWRAEEQRLRAEVAGLKQELSEAEAKTASAVAAASATAAAAALQKERRLVAAQAAPTASAPAIGAGAATSSAATPRYPAGPSSERKIGQLEATVAAMKADLQIMEMRMSIVQDEREAERRRILAVHEQERERLRRERDECQKIIDKMSRELQGLARTTPDVPAIASTSF